MARCPPVQSLGIKIVLGQVMCQSAGSPTEEKKCKGSKDCIFQTLISVLLPKQQQNLSSWIQCYSIFLLGEKK